MSSEQAATPATATTVVEVALRDGLQNDPADLSTSVKVELLGRLAAAGIRRAEITSFVGLRAVPKMADAEAVVEAARGRDDLDGFALIGLVVNERGVERAIKAGVHEVNAVVLATDAFNRRNQGEATADTLRRLTDVVPAARAGGLRVSVTVGASFGCPYEGEVPVGRVAEVVGELAKIGPDEIALADTIGVAVPADVTERFAAARDAAGSGPSWRAHFHNTRNTGYANAVAATAAGVNALDASLGGIGGCPFAPAATGNVATEDLAYLLARSGVATGLNVEGLIAAVSWLERRLCHGVPGMLSKAGSFPGPRGAR